GEDCLFPVEGLHAELYAAFESAQKLDQLGVAGKQQILDERRGVLEDHAEAKREDSAVLERRAENLCMPEQVTPLRRDLCRLDLARQSCELAIADRVDRRSVDARAPLRPRSFRPGDAVQVESGRGRRVSAAGDRTLDGHRSTALGALVLAVAVTGERVLRSLGHALGLPVAVTPT